VRRGSGIRRLLGACAVASLAACGAEMPADDRASSAGSAAGADDVAPMLGPLDGHDLPAADLERVAVGDAAPDFSLMSYRGDVLTLSENRGARDVVLVFYRGHW